ncbi:hypothetical protein GGX14DRAFT_657162 [Mycena pura]|uniref:Fungal-type protein kinase domain-containing protein n=1 Tax=Mycena pura TaxID=153505 RepID=A0AAD6YLJ6_9AGAR|nr:hypothetical protein GGX14DRAFT_657162 [Mycena pura]
MAFPRRPPCPQSSRTRPGLKRLLGARPVAARADKVRLREFGVEHEVVERGAHATRAAGATEGPATEPAAAGSTPGPGRYCVKEHAATYVGAPRRETAVPEGAVPGSHNFAKVASSPSALAARVLRFHVTAGVPLKPIRVHSAAPMLAATLTKSPTHGRGITTLDTESVARRQSEMKKEFGGRIWQFSPQRISQMLSPKRLKPTYTERLIATGHRGPLHPILDDHICLVDDPTVVNAIDGIKVPAPPRRAIDSAYNRLARAHPSIGEFVLKPIEKRWYPQLYFHHNTDATADCNNSAAPLKPDDSDVGLHWNNTAATVDCNDSAAPLKPDVVGLHEKKFNSKALPCCWGFLDGKNPRIQIPVEVRNGWPELVWQARTYAHALCRATPERAFRLVFGYNQATCRFRVLIFHNGGLAASMPCNLRTASGRKDAVRMLWPVLLWQDEEDAGFPSFTNGDSLALYYSSNVDWMARRGGILSHIPTSRGRGTVVFNAQLDLLTFTQGASSIGLQPETRLDGDSQRTQLEASLPSGTQASRGKFLLVFGRIRSAKYHDEGVASCITAEFCTLGAAFDPDGGLVTHQSRASHFDTSLGGSALSPSADCVVRISSPMTSGPGPLNETTMASACSGLFGLPITQTWFQGCFKSGRPVSSVLFEPTENEKDTLHWPVYSESKVSPNPDRRPMIVCAMKEEGMTLEQCASAQDLCESILHALLGWLAAYERGWLHLDPSIGNILRLCQDRPQSWGTHTKPVEDLAKSTHLDTRDSQRASEVEEALFRCGKPRVCKAILSDFDRSVYLSDYFAADHSDARVLSGTFEFMSVRSRRAFKDSKPYLQSPLDDLWAFFHSTVWATLFHAHRPSIDVLPMSRLEMDWQLHLGSPMIYMREGVIWDIIGANYFYGDFPPMLRAMAPFFKNWITALEQMEADWRLRQHNARTAARGGIGIPDFNHLAYSGVLDYVHIFTNHRERLVAGVD